MTGSPPTHETEPVSVAPARPNGPKRSAAKFVVCAVAIAVAVGIGYVIGYEQYASRPAKVIARVDTVSNQKTARFAGLYERVR